MTESLVISKQDIANAFAKRGVVVRALGMADGGLPHFCDEFYNCPACINPCRSQANKAYE